MKNDKSTKTSQSNSKAKSNKNLDSKDQGTKDTIDLCNCVTDNSSNVKSNSKMSNSDY